MIDDKKVEEKKPKQKKSVSYALKAIKTHVETLTEAGLFSKEQEKQISGIMEVTVKQYIKEAYGV